MTKSAMITAARKPKFVISTDRVPTAEELSAYFRKQWAKQTPEFQRAVLEGAAADSGSPMFPLTKQQLEAVRKHTRDWIESFRKGATPISPVTEVGDPWRTCRDAFVALIKKENADRDHYSRWSLKQHWSGAHAGFADENLQQRWLDFKAGWNSVSQPFDQALFNEVQRHD
jgi:hypothetical protein